MWLAVELVLGLLQFISRKNWQSDHEVEGHQKRYFKAYIIHSHGRTCFCNERGKRGARVEKGKRSWYKNDVVIKFSRNFLWGWEDEQKYGQFSFSFSNCPFWAYIKKIAHSLCGTWSFLLVKMFYTWWGVWRLCNLTFLRKMTMEVGPLEKAIFHGPTSWSMV